jgi:hypothetical protein
MEIGLRQDGDRITSFGHVFFRDWTIRGESVGKVTTPPSLSRSVKQIGQLTATFNRTTLHSVPAPAAGGGRGGDGMESYSLRGGFSHSILFTTPTSGVGS